MTSASDILDAIAAVLAKAFPKRPIYVNFCPDDFKRPCFLIEFISSTQTAASYFVNELTVHFTVTCFEKTVNTASAAKPTSFGFRAKSCRHSAEAFCRLETDIWN